MVGVAQLVEHMVVAHEAAGSSPVAHPKAPIRLFSVHVMRQKKLNFFF